MSPGTAAWNGDVANGNHNWVEVWRPGATGDKSPNATRARARARGGSGGGGGFWSPIEGLPAGGGESLDDPCTLWFCNPARFPAPAGQVRAAIILTRFIP